MFGLIEHAAEAALGPWGLLAGAIVGVALLRRRRRARAVETESRAAGPFRGPLRQAGTAVAYAGEWWSDLVAESRAEWLAEREGPTSAATSEEAAERLQTVATRTRRRRARGGPSIVQEPTQE